MHSKLYVAFGIFIVSLMILIYFVYTKNFIAVSTMGAMASLFAVSILISSIAYSDMKHNYTGSAEIPPNAVQKYKDFILVKAADSIKTGQQPVALPKDLVARAEADKQHQLAEVLQNPSVQQMAIRANSSGLISATTLQLFTVTAATNAAALAASALSAETAIVAVDLVSLTLSASSLAGTLASLQQQGWYQELVDIPLYGVDGEYKRRVNFVVARYKQQLCGQLRSLRASFAVVVGDALATLVPFDPLVVRSVVTGVVYSGTESTLASIYNAFPEAVKALLADRKLLASQLEHIMLGILPDKTGYSWKTIGVVAAIPLVNFTVLPWLLTEKAAVVSGLDMGMFNRITDTIKGEVPAFSRLLADAVYVSFALTVSGDLC